MTRYPYFKYVNYPDGSSSITINAVSTKTSPVFLRNFESKRRQQRRILKDLVERFAIPAQKRRRRWRIRQTKIAICLIGPNKQTIVLQKIFTNKC